MKVPAKDLSGFNEGHSHFGATMWHQDQAALTADSTNTQLLTIWVAMTDVSVERGCLAAMRGSHKKQTTIHCPGKTSDFDNSIPDNILGTPEGEQEATLLPVKRGGAVILTQYTEHGGMPNLTDKLRWSFDLRFNPAGQLSGRSVFPSFLARSKENPEQVL